MKLDKTYKMSKPTKTYLNCLRLNLNDETYFSHKSLFSEAEQSFEISRRKMSVKIVDTDEGNG